MDYKKHPDLYTRNWLSMPFIFAIIFPLVALDVFLEIYHRICFRLYRIPRVKRSDYIRIDRHKLKYLTRREKVGCVYCSYANGLFPYAAKIASETEAYWCGIKHKRNGEGDRFIEPPHHKNFLPYGDEKKYLDLKR